MLSRLLTTTAVALGSTGLAQADIALTGSAEMGIFSSSFDSGPSDSYDRPLQFFTDIDVTFTLSGETDGGIIFGATVDLDEALLLNRAGRSPAAVFISSDLGTLTLGDTDGAMDFAMIEVGDVLNPGSLKDDETDYFGYRGSYLDGFFDNEILRYDVALGDFSVAVSAELNDRGEFDPIYSFGLRYDRDYGNITVAAGIGYQGGRFLTEEAIRFERNGFAPLLLFRNPQIVGASGSVIWELDGPIDSIGVGLQTSRLLPEENSQAYWHHGLGLGLTSGPFSLHGNYGRFEVTGRFGGVESVNWIFEGFGLSAGYDLGGGMTMLAGYGQSQITRPNAPAIIETESFSLGLSMDF